MSCSGIPTENVFANTLLYDDDGEYKGFDPNEFTSQAGGTHSSRSYWPGVPSVALPFAHFVECCLCGAGKANAVAHIKATKGFETVVMIGDGATDAEAKDASQSMGMPNPLLSKPVLGSVPASSRLTPLAPLAPLSGAPPRKYPSFVEELRMYMLTLHTICFA